MKKILFSILLFTITTMQAQNPFLSTYKTPYGTQPFDKIKNEHYVPAMDKAIELHKKEINAITMLRSVPTFENTIVAFENSGRTLSSIASVFFNLLSAESNNEMQKIAQEIQPKLTEHSNSIYLNELLFQKVKTVYEKRFESNLNPEQIRLTEKIHKGFEKSGATLVGGDRDKYKELSQKLSNLTLEFGQNVLNESNKFEMLLKDDEEVAGLPQSVKDAAQMKAKSKSKEGYLFDLSAPSYIAFMKYSTRRDLREKLYRAYNTKCVVGGEFDNKENVKNIANTRLEIAKLLGYNNYASYVLNDKMAKDKKSVYSLLDNLLASYKTAAFSDVKEVEGFAVGMERKAINIQLWDWAFYSEKLKDAKYNVNDEIVRPYFELENVKKGVFGLATRLFGITFVKNTKIPVYHSEVEAFDVLDEKGQFISVLYTDFHPREGKRQGAWMTEFKGQFIEKGKDSRPHISIVMNFTRPTETDPALLTYDEVNTFLHEFGHALHGMLTKCTYETLSGTSVYRDFVELPSQIMENWLSQKEYLDSFAVHYKTGEKIPADLVQKLVDADNYNAGYLCYRQLSFGYLDMAWHSIDKMYSDNNVIDFERNAMKLTQLLPLTDGVAMSTSFNHIFAGGYAAGYYSYKWAEVLDADAFELFKQNGIFDKETAASFRKNILEKGNTEEPMSLYIKFRGQEPTVDALLTRNGLK